MEEDSTEPGSCKFSDSTDRAWISRIFSSFFISFRNIRLLLHLLLFLRLPRVFDVRWQKKRRNTVRDAEKRNGRRRRKQKVHWHCFCAARDAASWLSSSVFLHDLSAKFICSACQQTASRCFNSWSARILDLLFGVLDGVQYPLLAKGFHMFSRIIQWSLGFLVEYAPSREQLVRKRVLTHSVSPPPGNMTISLETRDGWCVYHLISCMIISRAVYLWYQTYNLLFSPYPTAHYHSKRSRKLFKFGV